MAALRSRSPSKPVQALTGMRNTDSHSTVDDRGTFIILIWVDLSRGKFPSPQIPHLEVSLCFPLGIFFGDILSFVVELLAPGKADLHLDQAAF